MSSTTTTELILRILLDILPTLGMDLIGASILSVHITYAQNSKFYLVILIYVRRLINDLA